MNIRILLIFVPFLFYCMACHNFQQPKVSLVYSPGPDDLVQYGVAKVKVALKGSNIVFEEVTQMEDAQYRI